MNKTLTVAVVLTLAGSTATLGYLQFKQGMENEELQAKQGELMANLVKAKEQLSVTSNIYSSMKLVRRWDRPYFPLRTPRT